MSWHDPARDREIREALRRIYSAPTPDGLAALSRRIQREARPLLARRRFQPIAWWEYPALWAGTLLPLGLATALAAAACLVWASSEPGPPASRRAALRVERLALLRAATSRASAPQLIDLVLASDQNATAATPARGSDR